MEQGGTMVRGNGCIKNEDYNKWQQKYLLDTQLPHVATASCCLKLLLVSGHQIFEVDTGCRLAQCCHLLQDSQLPHVATAAVACLRLHGTILVPM